MKEKKTKVKCHNCEYEWETKSEMIKVACPSCYTKTHRIKKDEK